MSESISITMPLMDFLPIKQAENRIALRKQYLKDYRERNREAMDAYQAQYREANREKKRAHDRAYWHKKHGGKDGY